MNKRTLGTEYETLAAEFLERHGLTILAKNFRCRDGEIDLVAKHGDYFVFVEVKYRKTSASGESLYAVGRRKQETIARVARYYLYRYVGRMDVPCRFDVIGIDGNHIHWQPNAFMASYG